MWFDRLVPVLGRAAAALLGSLERVRGAGAGAAISDAYEYLPNSVKRFPAPAALAAEMQRAGMTQISCLLLAGGIVAIHAGTVARGGEVA